MSCINRMLKRSGAVWLCALFAGGYSAPLLAQQPEPDDAAPALTVESVQFEGLEGVSETFCRNRIVTASGRQFSQRIIDEDCRRLIRTGKFLDVRYETATSDGRVQVTFVLRERPVIAEVVFDGNEKLSDKKIEKALDLIPGDPLNRFQIQQGALQIEQLYRGEGYAEVSVTVDEQALSERRVVYHIEEGTRTRVRSISFEGNAMLSEAQLRTHVQTKTYIPVFRAGRYDPDRVQLDAAALQNFYHERGFLDARVSTRTDPGKKPGDLNVVFIISEGDLYSIESITLEGNTVFDDTRLESVLNLRAGDTMRQDLFLSDADAVRRLYGEAGYINATVTPQRVFTAEPGRVALTLSIVEDAQYSIGKVQIRGNTRTQDRVVRRELDFFPTELINTTKLSEAEENLRATRLFNFAAVSAVGDQPGVRDVIVDVEESDQTTSFIIAGGVGSNSGLAGSLSYESRNFDLFDWPETWGEFFRARAFRGAGQYFRIQFAPGSDLSSFRIDFQESHLMYRPLRLGTSFYLFERIQPDYDEQRLGTNISLGKYFKKGLLAGWSGEISFRLEDVEISDIPTFPAKEIYEAKGHNLVTAFKGRLTKNRTDSRFFPTTGDRFSMSVEQATGDFTFTRTEADYVWYKTIKRDELNRPSVLALKGEIGYLFGNAPVFERFVAGGIGTLRGFEYRGVSPRGGPFFDDDQRIGGDFRILTGAEYSFPLYSEMFRGVIFTDMGTVEEDIELGTWRAAVGFGLRLYISRLSPAPFEFNLAFPVAKDSEDDTQVFSFAIGISF